MDDPRAIGLHDGPGAGKIVFRSAAHGCKLAVFGSRLPARYGRVDEADTALGRRLANRAGHGGRRRRMVDEQRAGLKRCECSAICENHLCKIAVIADAGEHDVRAVHGRGYGVGDFGLALMACAPGIPSLVGAVPGRDLVTGIDKVARHRSAHDAKPQERDFLGIPHRRRGLGGRTPAAK